MIRIDGSFGEGGGQILRTSLSLSLATGKAFRIDNIRAGRERSGLLRQHLTAVLAAAEISGAKVEGASMGSAWLTFEPGEVKPGEYRFAVGTAGSATLVFQTVLPALMIASGPSRLTLEGGTHNPAAPPYDFLARTFLPLIARMGPRVETKLERYGFYPAGGGRLTAVIEPCASLKALELGPRGEITSRSALAVLANLPRHIGQREMKTVESMMNWAAGSSKVVETRDSSGPGNVVMISIASAAVTEVFSTFGRMGVASEKVASEAVRDAREYLVSQAVAGEHLTDQLMVPLALAGGGSYTAVKMSRHAQTNAVVIREFLPVRIDVAAGAEFTSISISAADSTG